MEPLVSQKRSIVFSLHGIRTRGAWQKAGLTQVLSEAGFDHLALDYGFFHALRLLIPAVRRRQVDWFRDRYTAEMRGRSSLPSVIAHSFGTYIVAEAMRIYPEVCCNQVILCGSIVRRDFPWSKLIDAGQVRRVLNDYGQRDFWARIVVWAVDDAGTSGVEGFSDTAGERVLQRSHPDWRHSDFFHELNYRNWISFLQGNMPGPPGTPAGGTTNKRFRLTVLMCLALLATLGILLWLRVTPGKFYTLKVKYSDKCLTAESPTEEPGQRIGAQVVQWECNDGINQQWRIEPTEDGFNRLIARHSGRCLTAESPTDLRQADGVKFSEWTCDNGVKQEWKMKCGTLRDSFILKSRYSSKCLDVESSNADIGSSDRAKSTQWTCHGGPNQQWVKELISNNSRTQNGLTRR